MTASAVQLLTGRRCIIIIIIIIQSTACLHDDSLPLLLLLLLFIYTSPPPSYFQRWGLPCLNSEQLQLIGNKPPINGGFITGSAFALERLYFKAALIASQIGR